MRQATDAARYMKRRLADYQYSRDAGENPGPLLAYLGMTEKEFFRWMETGVVPSRVERVIQPQIDGINRAEAGRRARMRESELYPSVCIAHHRVLRWMPSPEWWVHADTLGAAPQTCLPMLAARAPEGKAA